MESAISAENTRIMDWSGEGGMFQVVCEMQKRMGNCVFPEELLSPHPSLKTVN
jgi:hypothetical protein